MSGPQREWIREVYEQTFADRVDVVPDEDLVLRLLLPQLPPRPDARILDAGCGSGRYARALVARGYSCVVGIDLIRGMTAPTFLYLRGSLAHIPLATDSMDAVFSISALYYLPDPEQGVRELARVLSPGGRLLLTAHTRYSTYTVWRRMKRLMGCAEHLRGVRFRPATRFCSWLEAAGLEVLRVDGYSPPMFIERLLGAERPRPELLARLRAVIGYHFILTAQKPH